MYDQLVLNPIRSITCLAHKKQKASHICTQLQCLSNPVLCGTCLNDSKFRNPHLNHQSHLRPISQALQTISNQIKNQIKPIESYYQKTLGHKDNQGIRTNLQKMEYLQEEIQNRINSIKMQVDLEMELLTKQFQRQMLLEKQQFTRKLDQYKKIFFTNLQSMKKQSAELVNFTTTLKYYSNPSTLLLKLSTQSQKRSLDWFLQQKKTLAKLSKTQTTYLFNPTVLQQQISKANQMNMMIKPVWVGQKKQLQSQKDLKQWIKNSMDSWVSIPELKDLSASLPTPGQYRNMYSPYSNPYSNTNIV